MNAIFLNFATFYHSAIKNNTSLPQFNAVSVLLLGNIREKCTEESIDDPSVSGYVNGKKPIRKSILMPLINISHEEVIRRLHMLGIQDIQRMVDALTTLINEVSNLSKTAKVPLFELAKKTGAEYNFVAEVFLTAVKCPTVFTRRLSSEMIQHLNSLGWPEQFEPISNSSDSSEGTQEPVSEPGDISEPVSQEESGPTPAGFSQEAKEGSVSYRSLSIPEDKEVAVAHFLSICGDSEDLGIILTSEDVEEALTSPYPSRYSMVELRGTCQSIGHELSRWQKLPNCSGCIIGLVVAEDADLDTIEKIPSDIQNLINEDASIIFGVKFAPELLTGQMHVCTIFEMKDVSQESSPAGKEDFQDLRKLHAETEAESAESDDDPFEEIFKIFNKK